MDLEMSIAEVMHQLIDECLDDDLSMSETLERIKHNFEHDSDYTYSNWGVLEVEIKGDNFVVTEAYVPSYYRLPMSYTEYGWSPEEESYSVMATERFKFEYSNKEI